MSPRSASSAAGSSEPDAGRGRWLVLGATFFWGTSATLARFMFRDRHVPALTVVELRLLFAAVLLGPWLAWRAPHLLRVRREDWLYFVVLGLAGVALLQGSYYYSISVLGVGLAILIQYLAPSLLVLWDLARGRRVSALTAIAVVAAIIGTALLVGDPGPAARHARWWQWGVSFGSAFVWAFYILYSKRGLERYRPPTVLFYTFLIGSMFWAAVTPPARILAAGYDLGLWGLFLLLGAFSTLIPFALFYAGLRRLPPTQTGILATVEPVIASVSAMVFLGEGLKPWQWCGAALVLSASALASLRRPEVGPAQIERA